MATITNLSQSFTNEYTQILGAVEGSFPFPGVTDFVTEIIISDEEKKMETESRFCTNKDLLEKQKKALEELLEKLQAELAKKKEQSEQLQEESVENNTYIRQIQSLIEDLEKQCHSDEGRNLSDTLLLGKYDPAEKKIYLYWNNIQMSDPQHVSQLLRIVYLHELMHAYFHQCAGGNGEHYIYEIEETMAELGMLAYCSDEDLDYARGYVQHKKNQALAPYGFADFCYEELAQEKSKALVERYATIAKDICHTGWDVIWYMVELNKYLYNTPQQNEEVEKVLFAKLKETILHFEQTQTLRFTDVYTQAKAQLCTLIWEKWNAQPGKEIDTEYKAQLDTIIDSTISENIMVESMAQWESATPIYKGGADYKEASRGLWQESYLPYKHQVESWQNLLKEGDAYKHSMVITTGTGSGKTECFMIPLVADIAKQIEEHPEEQGVQAIFLYPLNALMEDQKERLEKAIANSGKDIHFAVYNGQSECLKKYDNQGDKTTNERWKNSLQNRFKHELVFREEIRGKQWNPDRNELNPSRVPNILLTNPTMLEYILLRQVDRPLIQPGSLKWIVIDETHTYTGAGADELAMQIRRVLKAFEVTPDKVHFATSSATVGSDNTKLKEFISGITGQKHIDTIFGERSMPSYSLAEQDYPVLSKLASNNYVYLKDLISNKTTTEERLAELDRLAEAGLRVKVHFFAKALTNGLFVNMEDLLAPHGEYTLSEAIPLDTKTFYPDSRYLKACYCTKCGNVLAYGNIEGNKYDGQKERFYFAPASKYDKYRQEHNQQTPPANTTPLKILKNNECVRGDIQDPNAYQANLKCPCCGAEEEKKGRKQIKEFAISAMETNQGLLPSLLTQTTERENDTDKPFNGHQLISFADSRRGAAKPSMRQNLDTEEAWVISTLRKKIEEQVVIGQTKKEQLINEMDQARQNDDWETVNKISGELKKYKNLHQITWDEALDALKKDDFHKYLAACFAKEEHYYDGRKNNNDDEEEDEEETLGNNLNTDYCRRYVLSALYRVMSSRKRYVFSAERHGLLKVVYPRLDEMINDNYQLPGNMLKLNEILRNQGKKEIDKNDWKNLLQIYLDYDVRINNNTFFRSFENKGWQNIDISACRDLSSSYTVRRSIKKSKHNQQWIIYRLLLNLLGFTQKDELEAQIPGCWKVLEDIGEDMWNAIVNPAEPTNLANPNRQDLLSWGEHYKNGWQKDVLNPKDIREGFTGCRLNLAHLVFELVDEAWEDDATESLHNVTFCGLSPYDDDEGKSNFCTKISLSNGVPAFIQCTKRDNALGGKENLFIQVEHTAQVKKSRAKERIQFFKDHQINVLACSTTMEMGVDIGELEIVAMANVPPHPANFKQRVGRAGRRTQSKSVSVTTCNSDEVGLPILDDPKTQLLEREVKTPVTRLHSPQIVQRHINSYMLREFFEANYTTAQIKTWKLVDFFLKDGARISYDGSIKRLVVDNVNCYPIDYPNHRNGYNINYFENSPYTQFITWLDNCIRNNDYETDIQTLTIGTCLQDIPTTTIINNVKKEIKKVYKSWLKKFENICEDAKKQGGWPETLPEGSKYRRINFEFISLLSLTIETYLGENQFIPNANMPVDVVAALINKDKEDSYDNPSRPLPIALAEYAPGHKQVMDGKTYQFAGVTWDSEESFTQLAVCPNCGHTINGTNNGQPCPVCGNRMVKRDMIVPTAFLPEESTSRTMDEGKQTYVHTQLLLDNNAPTPRPAKTTPMIQVLSGNEVPDASVLRYISGINHTAGYCVCKQTDGKGNKCGRTVAETTDDSRNDSQYYQYYQELIKDGHKNLMDSNQEDSFDMKELFIHKLIGGTFKTDFSLLYANRVPASHSSASDEILNTLGLIICDELSKHLPCERQDIDFFIAGIGSRKSLCIYDMAKGGAGYSSQLDANLWQIMLDKCREKLKQLIDSNNPELNAILSRSTMRYKDKIDIKGTYDWLCQEYENRITSQLVLQVYPNAIGVDRGTMTTALSNNAQNKMLFFQNDMTLWNYDLDNGSVSSWKILNNDTTQHQQKIPVVFNADLGMIPIEWESTINKIQDWATLHISRTTFPDGIYPLAYVERTLYFTDNAEYAQLNGLWAKDAIYAVTLEDTDEPQIVDYTPTIPQSQTVWIDASKQIKSTALYDLVEQLDNAHTMSGFLAQTKGHRLQFIYTDEHVKSQMSMCIAIQFIKRMAEVSKCSQYSVEFRNEEYADQKGKTIDDTYRTLWDNLFDNVDRDDLLDECLGQLLNNDNSCNEYTIDPRQRGRLPHWRCLEVIDLDTDQTLKVMPHGGFANDWELDTETARQERVYYNCQNTNIETSIPLRSKNKILYILSTVQNS